MPDSETDPIKMLTNFLLVVFVANANPDAKFALKNQPEFPAGMAICLKQTTAKLLPKRGRMTLHPEVIYDQQHW